MQHTHSRFDTDLQALRSVAAAMGADVERQFLLAVQAVRTRDLRLATEVLEAEVQVNRAHLQIDLMCNQIIARRQPIAVDLREVLSILHINNDLERIGDEAKKIAYRARDLHGGDLPVDVAAIEHMAQIVSSMVRSSVQAFMTLDARVSETMRERDAEVDRLRDALVDELVASMSRAPAEAKTAMALVFVVQSIERVGDHAKNVAEYVVNVVEGVDTRHRGNLEPGASR